MPDWALPLSVGMNIGLLLALLIVSFGRGFDSPSLPPERKESTSEESNSTSAR